LIISGDTALDGGWTLTADGTINWTGGTIYFGFNLGGGTSLGGTNTFVNAAGASFLDQNTGGLELDQNTGTGIFDNAGLFDKTVASGSSTTNIGTIFTNQSTGVLAVEAGVVRLLGSVTNSGVFEESAARSLPPMQLPAAAISWSEPVPRPRKSSLAGQPARRSSSMAPPPR